MPNKRSNWKRKSVNTFVILDEAQKARRRVVNAQRVYFEISSSPVRGSFTVDEAKKIAYDYELRGKVYRIRFTDPKGVRRTIRGYTGAGRNVTAYVQGLKGLKTIPPKEPIDHLMRDKYKSHLKFSREFTGVREKED